MKKGHRRTYSENILAHRPFQEYKQKPIKQQSKTHKKNFEYEKFNHTEIAFPSIQALLQKSQVNVTQRVLCIQNLDQPNGHTTSNLNFTFGKGVNFKLNNCRLNMGQIPQVPKSNQSTSLHGENKIESLEIQILPLNEVHEKIVSKHLLPENKVLKSSMILQKRTKTASTVTIKPINRWDKIQKMEKIQPKNQFRNTLPTQPKSNVNTIKKPKPEYLTHKKNALSFGGTIGGNTKLKVRKQVQDPLTSELKKKRKNFVF